MPQQPSPLFYAKVLAVIVSLGSAVGFNIWLWNFADNRWNQEARVESMDARLKTIEAREEARVNRAIERGSMARRAPVDSAAGAGEASEHDHRATAATAPP